MEMKRSVIAFAALFSLILVSGLVAAQALPAPPVTAQQFSNFLGSILTSGFGATEEVVGRVLVFLLLAAVLYRPLEKITGDNSNVGLLISVVLSIGATRFLTQQMVYGFFLPTATLGLALSIFIPIIIYGAIITTSDLPRSIRKVGWWLFAVIFLVLWWTRFSQIGDLAYVYVLAAAVAILGAVFDGTVNRWVYRTKVERGMSVSDAMALEAAEQELRSLNDRVAVATETGRAALVARRKEVLKDIDELLKAKQ